MLQVINLKKIYKTKGGATVNALDGVTLSFPERGMVFLLGRSGSGKSTLLNVAGGLDSPTDGEIIVKGRSSKDFSQSDFDSYRNTFVGFIFQEYNILDEFTVENNIALALELQGKSKDKEAIERLLRDVDLEGYGKRKPNTLSGGQKQRIAIARALIKNPEIIMADEPTGALDSNTGKQVFDTLKKLSRDKLVIVVSHDRDFAEQYGDRIIELADGKVISDTTKTEEPENTINENVSVVGDSILSVKNGEELDDEDFAFIKSFLRGKKNAMICSEDGDVRALKRAAKITDSGSKEVFRDTDEKSVPKKSYTDEESRFIRSKLPARHAFKLGASGMKTKPVRLIFTALLCTVAFILFGLLSTMMLYNNDAVFRDSLMASDYSYMGIGKQFTVTGKYYQGNELVNEHSYRQQTKLTKDDIDGLSELFGTSAFGAIGINRDIENLSSRPNYTDYYTGSIKKVAALDEGNELLSKVEYGKYPETENEICLTSYTAQALVAIGLSDPDSGEAYTLSGASDVVGKTVVINATPYTVSGIIACDPLPAKYDVLKEEGEAEDWTLSYYFAAELESGIYQLGFVTEERLQTFISHGSESINLFNGSTSMGVILNRGQDNEEYWYLNYGKLAPNAPGMDIYCSDGAKATLADDEIVIDCYYFLNLLERALERDTESEAYKKWNSSEYDPETGEIISYSVREMFSFGFDPGFKEIELAHGVTRESCREAAIEFLNTYGVWNNIQTTVCAINGYSDVTEAFSSTVVSARVVGFFVADSFGSAAFVSDAIFESFEAAVKNEMLSLGWGYSEESTDYVVPEGVIYDMAFIAYDRTEASTNLLKPYTDGVIGEDNGIITLNNPLVESINQTNMMVESLSKVFLYVGIVMAVFAALLLSNFISVSISTKTREIGILRAVGARSIDVFKIFFSEAFIICTICVILSCIGGAVTCAILNAEVSELIGGVSLFVFGPASVGMLIGVAAVTAVAATFIPVYRAAKRKPVESIRAL